MQPDPSVRADTFFAAVGGDEVFRELVAQFYRRVATDPVLRPLYPEEDLGPAQERLRMRHAPFTIGLAERDAWLGHMREALDTLHLPRAYDDILWEYLTRAADSMRNVPV